MVFKLNSSMADNIKGIVRIAGADIIGSTPIYPGLLKIKGVGFSFSNAICNVLGHDKEMKIGALSDDQIAKIVEFIKNPKDLPSYMLNRQKRFETGENVHLTFSDLKLQIDFDLKRMKKTKTYKGLRHSKGLPVRGQRTKAHFRSGKAIGVKKSKKGKKG
jgi:small subunit ribosomal protein S13